MSGIAIAVCMLIGFIFVPIGMIQHRKYHDKTTLWIMLTGLFILVVPVAAVFIFLIILGIGLNRPY